MTIVITFGCMVCSAFLEHRKERDPVAAYYSAKLEDLLHRWQAFTLACVQKAPKSVLQKHFLEARAAYKKQAVLGEYYYPLTARMLNSAAIKRVEDDNPDVVLDPHGFQVMEEMLFGEDDIPYEQLAGELQLGGDQLSKTLGESRTQSFHDAPVFEAMRFSVIRLMALGLAGFDTPVAQNIIAETQGTLQGIEELFGLYAPRLQKLNPALLQQVNAIFKSYARYLPPSASFVSLDRIAFIKKVGNPLLQALTEARTVMGIPAVPGKKLLAADAVNLFALSSFDLSFFSPGAPYGATPERIRLGRRLFSDPILSSNGKSCGSCHKPELAFTDGLRTPRAADGTSFLKRNTPTLWNTVFQTRQFYDSRSDILETQFGVVVHNKDEMAGSLQVTADMLAAHPVYGPLFREAYSGVRSPFTPFTIANAVSSYVRSLVAMNTAFDSYMLGDSLAITEEARRGFNLFMGKAKCGTCHFIPFFNGLVPPDFDETESEVIGVPAADRKNVLDEDEGKFLFTQAETDRHSFKTPTVRNSALTAPYMHNGVFRNLRQVIRFYNRGGGRLLKNPPAQLTLPPEKLHLDRSQQKALLAFLQALTDTTMPVSIRAGM